MTEAVLPDGRILEFPDGTDPAVIQQAVKRVLGVDSSAQDAGFNAPAIEAGTAFEPTPVQRDSEQQGFGLDPTVTERPAIVPLRIVDNEIEFITPQIVVDIMDAFALPGQVFKGKQPTDFDLLNFVTAFGPVALKGGVPAIRKAISELPTAQAAEDELTVAIKTISGGRPRGPGDSTVEELDAIARAARFKEQGIPATRGDITQEFAQQADEQRLLSMATGETGEPLRQLKLEQSQAFVSGVDDLVNSLGVPARTGDSIKDALTGRKQLLRTEKNALYKEVADASPDITSTPIFTDGILDATPDAKTIRRLRRLSPNSVEAVEDLMVEFGIDAGDEAVEAFLKTGGEITPLNLGNFEEFRVALGQIDRSDQTGAVSVITSRIRDALDDEATFIDEAIKGSGVTDQTILDTLKEARSRVRTLKTEFSPQAISGRLIDVKRDGVTPVIEASKVAQDLLRPNAPIENLQRTLASLRNSGARGQKAIQDLRASVIMDALENALRAPSRKTSGIETVGGNQFANALSKFGDDKLAVLFEGNEQALNSLLNLKQTALDITPTAGAVPRGSAPVILDLVKRAGRLPGLAAIVDALTFVVKAGADDRAVAKALRANPVVRKTLVGMRRNFPTIFERLGILAVLDSEESER